MQAFFTFFEILLGSEQLQINIKIHFLFDGFLCILKVAGNIFAKQTKDSYLGLDERDSTGHAAHTKRVSDDVAGGKFMGTRKKILSLLLMIVLPASGWNGDSCGSGQLKRNK